MVDHHGVTVRSLQFLSGPNLFAYMPVMHLVLDVGRYDDLPSDEVPHMTDRLLEWLPGLYKHQCSVGRPGGFIERLRRGTYLPHIVEHITLELQTLMGFDVSFGRARGTGEPGVYNVVIAYREAQPARHAFETALRLTLAAMHDEPFDCEREIEALLAVADEYRLGPSTAAIVDAARRRSIPILRITPTGSLIQLGYGKYQKRILASETSNTSAIAVELCQEKPLTNRMLRMVGVAVPDGETTDSADGAWAIAQAIGLPVVVKPESGNQGKGVSVNLSTEAEVRAAFAIAQEYDRDVLVERYIHGHDYRLLVVNGRLVAAARRDPAQVVGDGLNTVRQLVEAVNQDPRRRAGHSSILTRIRLDDAAHLVLAQQDLTCEAVPAAGQVVRLRHNCNLSTGGTAVDVTDEVHPANARVAELAAQILALDVAGIDLLCRDISRPLDEQDGAVVEVNAAPGLRMHLHPAAGQPRDVGVPIVEMLYPNGAPTRIPIIAVTGTNGKTTVTRLIGHIFETAHHTVGMTTTEGIYLNGRAIVKGDCSGPRSAQTVLLHPQVEVAVLETARGGILREGLAFDRCAVGVVTNISADHLGLKGIDTLEQLARVKQVVVESVSRDGAAVLNADDPLVAEMAAATDGRVVYFSMNANSHILKPHLAQGGACVCVSDGTIMLRTADEAIALIELDRIPFTRQGRIRFQVLNALAAAAAAWAAGVNPALIARALTTFTTDAAMTPGRFNVTDVNGIEIILDYAHNAAAMHALSEAVVEMGDRRTHVILTLPGDRADRDLIRTFQAALPMAHAVWLHDSHDRRGRAVNAVPELLLSHAPAEVVCAVARDQHDALMQAWQAVRPGDRLVVIADVVDETLALLDRLSRSASDSAGCVHPVEQGTGEASFAWAGR